MFGKLISKLQLSKSPEEREGKKCVLILMILNNFSMHRPILCLKFFLPELLSNMSELHAFSCHQLVKDRDMMIWGNAIICMHY